MTDVYIVSGVRTAVGTFGGALKDTTPSELVAAVAKEAVGRSGIDPAEIESASWWDRGDVRQMLAHKHPAGIWVPGPHAIAHWLIARFADGEL